MVNVSDRGELLSNTLNRTLREYFWVDKGRTSLRFKTLLEKEQGEGEIEDLSQVDVLRSFLPSITLLNRASSLTILLIMPSMLRDYLLVCLPTLLFCFLLSQAGWGRMGIKKLSGKRWMPRVKWTRVVGVCGNEGWLKEDGCKGDRLSSERRVVSKIRLSFL